MSFREDDLRAALGSLAGDPVQDAARVLASLSTGTSIPLPPRRPLWPLIAAACAAGILAGWGAATLVPRGDTPAQPTEPQVGGGGRGAPLETARLERMTGSLELVTDHGAEPLRVGDSIAYDHFVRTPDKSMVMIRMPGDIELRVNVASTLTLVSPRGLVLRVGELWVKVPSSAGRFVVETGEGTIEARASVLAVSARPDAARVVVLDGHAVFTGLAGDTRELSAGQLCESQAALVGAVQPSEPGWTYMSWQHELLWRCGSADELVPYLQPLVLALEDEWGGKDAESELRRLGDLGVMAIAYAMPEKRDALRQRCMKVMCDIASGDTVAFLFDPLQSPDPDERALAAGTIERITAVPSGKDEEFWREATPAERFDALRVWRERIQGF